MFDGAYVDIKKRSFVHVPLNAVELGTDEIRDAVHWYLLFLTEVSQSKKRRIHYKSPYHRGTAVGYCDARACNAGEKPKDPKEYFHWNPSIKKYRSYQNLLRSNSIAAEFFNRAEVIYRKAEQMAYVLFRYELPSAAYDRCFEGEQLVNGHLRFLCYTPGDHAFRAKAHYDKGQGTLALLESCPGLRVGCCAEHSLAPVFHRPEHAIFMPGQLLWDDLKGEIIPAWHDVEHLPGTPTVSERCARWAVVFFINDKGGRYPEWDATHRPLPVHEPWRELIAA